MKRYIRYLFLILGIIIIFTGCEFSNKELSADKESIEIAKKFVVDYFNDNKIMESNPSEFISDDSNLGEFIADRREIMAIISPRVYAKRELIDFKIDDIKSLKKNDFKKVVLKCTETFLEDGITYNKPLEYYIYLDNNDKIYIAYSTDITSLILLSKNRADKGFHNQEWMIDKNIEKPYNLEDRNQTVAKYSEDFIVDDETFKTIERLVLGFIFDIFSDYRINNGDPYNYTDNEALVNFINDKRAFYKSYYEKYGQEIISRYNVNYDIKIDYYTENIKLAYISVDHEFLNGGEEISQNVLYLMVIDIRGPRILACLSNEPLSDELLGISHESFNSLDLNWQLNPDIEKPYNIEDRIKNYQL